jgi:hypothetical protein
MTCKNIDELTDKQKLIAVETITEWNARQDIVDFNQKNS